MATATATATAVTISDLAGKNARFQFEHSSFLVLSFNCTVEETVRNTVKLWVYDIERTEDTAMMILPGDTKVERAEYEGQVYYRVKL